MPAYFNEIEPFACAWLANLYPDARIDTRSIRDVRPDELVGLERCHFFAGLAGWEYALHLAGWPDHWPVWTGSCPCQPFSAAGKRQGEADERHLWPELFRLIRECRPPVVLGEQVASKDGLRWLDGVCADLESAGYACGAVDLCAASQGQEAEGWIVRGDQADWERIVVGAPHIRQRLFWVAVANGGRLGQREKCHGESESWEPASQRHDAGGCCVVGHPANDTGSRLQGAEDGGAASGLVGRLRQPERGGAAGGVALANEGGWACSGGEGDCRDGVSVGRSEAAGNLSSPADAGDAGRLPDTDSGGCGEQQAQPRAARGWEGGHADGSGGTVGLGDGERQGLARRSRQSRDDGAEQPTAERAGGDAGDGAWSDFLVIPCRDGKARRISAESGDVPLAHGVPRDLGSLVSELERMDCAPDLVKRAVRNARGRLAKAGRNRTGRLRGFGNAISPQAAAAFIRVVMEYLQET